MGSPVGEAEWDLSKRGQRSAHVTVTLRGGGEEEESSAPRTEQLPTPGAGLAGALIEAVDRMVRGPGGGAALELPSLMEQLSDASDVPQCHAVSHPVGEVPDLQEAPVTPAGDRLPLLRQDVVPTLPGGAGVKEKEAAVQRGEVLRRRHHRLADHGSVGLELEQVHSADSRRVLILLADRLAERVDLD